MNNQEQSPPDSNRSDGTGMTLDQLFDALSHPRRRRILTTLANADPRDEDEFVPADFTTSSNDPDVFLASLHHVHLPYLADADFIEWDRETNTIQHGPQYDEIDPVIELLIDHQDELPKDWP